MQKEKVSDTKHKLQALVSSTPQAGDKSLLLQSVALLETLLAKIHTLQAENEEMKKLKERDDLKLPYEEVVLELESTREKLEKANQVTGLSHHINVVVLPFRYSISRICLRWRPRARRRVRGSQC